MNVTDLTSPADRLAAINDELAISLLSQRCGVFTGGELNWLMHFATKLRWATSEEYEQAINATLKEIAAKVVERTKESAGGAS